LSTSPGREVTTIPRIGHREAMRIAAVENGNTSSPIALRTRCPPVRTTPHASGHGTSEVIEEETMIRLPLTTDSVERHIEASPEALYDVIADVTRTPELSPEIISVKWIRGATGPAVGARFRAWNKVPGRPRWCNAPRVIVADRGREFAFSRTELIGGTLVWRYVFTPEGSGTRVTESYKVTTPIPLIGWIGIGGFYGLNDRRGDLRRGMTDTLTRLAAVVEQPTGAV
jgi:Polyketide cyclase / dehydrase and lipid transport